jgi:hypothetical protein
MEMPVVGLVYNVFKIIFFFLFFISLNATMSSRSGRHSLTINDTTFHRLKKKGYFGESFSDLISRILEELENSQQNGGSSS